MESFKLKLKPKALAGSILHLVTNKYSFKKNEYLFSFENKSLYLHS